jgi:hypothetical protein
MKRWVRRVRAGFLAIDRTYGAGVWRDLRAEGPSCGEPVPALRMSQCVKKHALGLCLLQHYNSNYVAVVCATIERHVFGRGAGNLIPNSSRSGSTGQASAWPPSGRRAVRIKAEIFSWS